VELTDATKPPKPPPSPTTPPVCLTCAALVQLGVVGSYVATYRIVLWPQLLLGFACAVAATFSRREPIVSGFGGMLAFAAFVVQQALAGAFAAFLLFKIVTFVLLAIGLRSAVRYEVACGQDVPPEPPERPTSL
jgi:hypothetical protein